MKPEDLSSFLLRYRRDPVGFVRDMFPWGKGILKDFSGPLDWQIEVLEEAGKVTRDRPVQVAVASGHGIGKSALTAWLILWAISTFPQTRGVVTANTESQLRTKTFAELARWYNMSPLTELFVLEASSLKFRDPEYAKEWRIDIVPQSERNPDAFQGLHNRGRRQIMIFDEAAGIPDVIYQAAQGFLTDKNTERLWFLFGNPTRNTGFFRECFPPDGRNHRFWVTKQIDARTVPITDPNLHKQIEEMYGPGSDEFRVRVLGQFPTGSLVEFIPRTVVREAAQRELPPPEALRGEPLVMGVDVARAGDNDTCVFLRRGLNGRAGLWRWNGASIVDTAEQVAALARKYDPQMIFIDAGGVGGGVVDVLRRMGLHNITPVEFGGKPIGLTPGIKPLNRRVEMWFEMREWLRLGGCIPDDDRLIDELSSPHQKKSRTERLADYLMIESKQEMAARGAPSPDAADALALTFALPVVRQPATALARKAKTVYNPLGSSLEADLQEF